MLQSESPYIEYKFQTPLDNYEPIARNVAYGQMRIHAGAFEHSPARVIIFDAWGAGIPDPEKAGYLVDDGQTIEAFYVVGWSKGDDVTPQMLMLHPIAAGAFPLGPRKTYHLSLTK